MANQTEHGQTERKVEEAHLAECIGIIKASIAVYEDEVNRMSGEIKEMYDQYRDNDPEIFTELSNTITMNENMKTALAKNLRALKKPYFGRIDVVDISGEEPFLREASAKEAGKTAGQGGFAGQGSLAGQDDACAQETDDRKLVPGQGRTETFYLGKGGVMKDKTHILVVDWRAPIANVYYENGLGECSYLAPGGRRYTIDLQRKRTYEIDQERLIDYYDSEVVANDELLTKYLAKNKEAVLGEIIATIQKEQNDIIRKSPYRSMIVQGVAGSGKTTVAMHRISYILYNYAKDFKPEDFYIIGSNRILLNYITGVLPELDVYGIKQMTMEQLFVRLLYEDWNDKKYEIISCEESADRIARAGNPADMHGSCGGAEGGGAAEGMQTGAKTAAERIIRRKGTKEWFGALAAYCETMEDSMIPQDDIYFQDEILFSKEQINRYRASNAILSIQTKIDGLNERTLVKLRNELTGHDLLYTPEERRALIKEYTGRFGAKKWRKPIFEIYDEFCAAQGMPYVRTADAAAGTAAQVKKGCSTGENRKSAGKKVQEKVGYDVYDLAALAYIYKRCKETERIREAHHIVIDEAQDFGMMAYEVLHYCIPGCSWTIMGDVSQNIHFGFGLNDWEELKGLILCDPKDTFGVLSKSYRNTVEISDFAQEILRHGSFSSYPIEPIIRHGNPVQVKKCPDHAQALESAVKMLKGWQKNGLDTIAVICRDEAGAAALAAELGRKIKIEESDLSRAEFKQGIMVLPVSYTKGLEFDAVLLFEPTQAEYPEDDGHAKLLYVAATRALHELAIVHTEDVTALLA